MTRKELLKLERAVNARRKLVQKIVKFVCKIVCAYGENTHRSERSCNTHTKWELNDVAGFNFKAEFGQTSMGGNDVYIYYEDRVVFHAYYQAGISECEVRGSREESRWLPEFKKFMRNYRPVLAQRERNQKKDQNKTTNNNYIEERRQELLKEARRLGLTAE